MVALPKTTRRKEQETMKIIDIKSVETNETRTDGRYPLRIGSTVEFYLTPSPGSCMLLAYTHDNLGNPKWGYLRTSTVTDIDETENEVIVTTRNSIYYLEK